MHLHPPHQSLRHFFHIYINDKYFSFLPPLHGTKFISLSLPLPFKNFLINKCFFKDPLMTFKSSSPISILFRSMHGSDDSPNTFHQHLEGDATEHTEVDDSTECKSCHLAFIWPDTLPVTNNLIARLVQDVDEHSEFIVISSITRPTTLDHVTE